MHLPFARRALVLCLLIANWPWLPFGKVVAAPPRAAPQGTALADRRLQSPKDYDGYFPFAVPESPEGWNQRAAVVRRQLEVALGLWPPPQKTPLNAVVHGRIERDDYAVEKVFFEAVPGFFVTGSLYRPLRVQGKVPGVLCPHGHWSEGRFHDAGTKSARNQMAEGAERFEEAGHSPLQARCVQLARMGCLVFHYDMIGYADSRQISFELAHRFAKQRPEMNAAENWGLFSPQAESHLQSIMGLQTWSSIRALDFLLTLDQVDPARLGVTGASGGGTQSFVLAAVDPRVALAVPCVMVSTAMQGGCTCENCSLLRVETGNVEMAALFAPKPLLLTAADDWTKEMPSKGFPELASLYERLGAKDRVKLAAHLHFGHNYNHVARTAMYGWVNQHFGLGHEEPVLERDFRRLTREEMTVWNSDHPAPTPDEGYERRLLRQLHDDAQSQLASLIPRQAEGLAKYREVVGGALSAVAGASVPRPEEISWQARGEHEHPWGRLQVGLLHHTSAGSELPVLVLQPKAAEGPPARHAVIWLTEQGKAGLFQNDEPRPEIGSLLAKGVTVVGLDLIYQGEFLNNGQPLAATPRVKNPREAAAYTFGFNRAVLAQRAQDVLTAVALARSPAISAERVDLVALDAMGPVAAVARSQAGEALARTALNTHGFRFGRVTAIHAPEFLPGGAKYFDLPGFLSLAAPGKLLLAGEGNQLPEPVAAVYAAAGAANHARSLTIEPEHTAAAAVDWLLAN